VFQPRARNIIRKALQNHYPHQTKVLNKKTLALKTNGGVMILSRHPIKRTEEIRYRQRQGIDRLARKGALLAEIEFRGRPLQIVGTHLQAFGTTAVMYAQYHQLHNELLKRFEQTQVPQIICGDFNTLKNLPPQLPPSVTQSMIDRLARYPVMMSTLQAQDGELLGEQQFTIDRPFNDLCKTRKEYRLLIDYFLLKPNGLSLFEVSRQVRIVRQRWHKNHHDLSDHFALEAVLTFR
jgi:endonuclease/exonuclease/phosphatase family metal-dependent hydrolase